VIEFVARDDRIAHTTKYQPAVFVLHLESAVELALRDARRIARLVAFVVVSALDLGGL
jgi:hypothetical protein